MGAMLGAAALFELNTNASAVAISASGNSSPIDVTDYGNFLVMCAVTQIPTGTTPTLSIHLDGLDPWGNVYQDLCSPQPILQFDGAVAQQVASIGLNAQFVASSAPGTPGNNNLLFCAPTRVQLRWVLSVGANYPAVYMVMYARGL